MPKLKDFLGHEIMVSETGNFYTTIRNKGRVERAKLADLEKEIEGSIPEGHVEVMEIPYLSASRFQVNLPVSTPKKNVIVRVGVHREGRGKYATVHERFITDVGATLNRESFARYDPEIIEKFESLNARFRAFMADLYAEADALRNSMQLVSADEIRVALGRPAKEPAE